MYSQTLKEHLEHSKIVIKCLTDVGLKLKPSKCCFVQKELEYLGHIVTPDGLKADPRLVKAVRDYPVPQSVQLAGLNCNIDVLAW